ncbi:MULTISPECIES: LysR family transcriptional regulator [Halomonas]|uniref:LysR family transcriptional regulator n=1 Tax=Halomonas TaxID=2745 RepID=UPI001C97D5E8|nr:MULTISPECIES: LysR family transcriptional regulator [Halomonas]MBY6207813.1 LysR family transcriptional regulator [Halomonas sp. DP3Y7-2]MBY6228622.1 LysR family transcriptional regulator [Halomonas sp. DP3Y7-1]MCA0916688.1 LysR family transcriptional regulator [Halomonas denitrificans]
MDTDGLRLFVLAAETLNISAAGRQLGIAPAVASARLSKLETQVGADLLHRSTRKVSLSPEGAAFLPFAREMLAQADAGLEVLGKDSEDVVGRLRFAASSTFAQQYIAPILPEFLERYPGISVDLRLSDTQMNLIEGGYDLALRNYPIEDSSLKARKLADDRRILCASPGYLERYGIPTSPQQLAEHSLLVFQDGAPRALAKHGVRTPHTFPPAGIKPRVYCDDGASMRYAALAGVGITMHALWSVRHNLDQGNLIRVLPDYEVDDRSAIWLVYPKSSVVTAKVRVFIDFLLEKIGDPPVWER